MGLFGPPKITMTLEKYNFIPGEIAKGTVKLNLKKPIYARKLLVSLIGVRRVRQGNSWKWQKVYDFDMPILEKKTINKKKFLLNYIYLQISYKLEHNSKQYKKDLRVN